MANQDRRFTATPQLKLIIRSQGRMDRWVADRIGMSKGHFSRVLSGTRTVSEAQAEQIVEILGVPLFLVFEVSYETNLVREVSV